MQWHSATLVTCIAKVMQVNKDKVGAAKWHPRSAGTLRLIRRFERSATLALLISMVKSDCKDALK